MTRASERVDEAAQKVAASLADGTSGSAADAVYDVALIQAIKPTTADLSVIDSGRGAPDWLLEPRTIQALFRAPARLSPFSDAQLQQIARAWFRQAWPNTAAAEEVLREMIATTRTVLMTAGRLATKAAGVGLDSLATSPGGAWLLSKDTEQPSRYADALRAVASSGSANSAHLVEAA